MRVFFRVDASSAIGTGHVFRCLALASALRQRGANVQFFCRPYPGNLNEVIIQRGFPVTPLPLAPAHSGFSSGENYSQWLGIQESEDAQQTIEALRGVRPNWLVVDHYSLGMQWEQALRPHTERLMVIDDLEERHHDCDLLLNQNFSDAADSETRAKAVLHSSCALALGPKFALLSSDYAPYRATTPPREGEIRKVFVFFGGSDPQNLTSLALEALSHSEFSAWKVDVVVGSNHQHKPTIEALAGKRPHTMLHGIQPSLASLMAKADLALGAGGASTWERMCLGLPSVVICAAENQKPACTSLARANLIQYAGDYSSVTAGTLHQSLLACMQAPQHLARLSSANMALVDGQGTSRIAKMLGLGSEERIWLRPLPQNEKIDSMAAPGLTTTARGEVRYVASLGQELPVGQIGLRPSGKVVELNLQLDSWLDSGTYLPQLLLLANEVRCASTPNSFLSTSARPKSSIAILSDPTSWLNIYIAKLALGWIEEGHAVLWVHDQHALRRADHCFYLSCGQIVAQDTLALFRQNLVVHESDLPAGKGWSPLTWQVLAGCDRIPVTLFEAKQKVDSGHIYSQKWIPLEGHELLDELREAQARATLELCQEFVASYPEALENARPQVGTPSFYRRRGKADSALDPKKPIADQFNLLRVVDNERYPAFFSWHGHRYRISITKADS